ncbi:fumarylacetoacetate hydrolase family protein [Bordetella holmesii]|uniref:FAH family protein n=2 Tax=Bordetella holmesii TaxID=35814 RepID=A0A158M326_9BORD|nr:fumarylacetoacetate hydrolase family protein [Bordetella holmesii]AHV92915.1 fumarylacetoacetate (FAA) hydrolase family protein [Bordetella holmesii ATCC 51541]AIT24844.1 fumarylacetoacetate (FAA) hydrolase family protein [Bordetella holmesii 44057]EWM45415.1 fumarylacetoacetate (FAA) hydrolase family protein [Bordetella holmesii 70147]EWM48345.1 fumarylacetoacetate (FAA) hydrolase family protein [Bordetella holmesii 41130]EWM49530.1 fumarylacetoacetate (FAA) hydrolase family protein [Borde
MKLISFLFDSQASYGVLQDQYVLDLGAHYGAQAPDLKTFLAAGLPADVGAPRRELAGLRLLPVIPNPGQIFCVGLNYADHVKETGRQSTEHPTIFMRVADSQVAHGEAIVLPAESSRLDYEGEIAIVIGKAGRRIAEADAGDYIAGYACYNDGSIRDWQTATSQWTAGKNFWRTGGFGPWLVTADEIPFGSPMTLVTRLNGQEMQRTTTDLLIHSFARQIAHLSTFTPLAVGDVIVTGTPGGVGAKRQPPVFMRQGDVVEIEVDRIGVLRNTVATE